MTESVAPLPPRVVDFVRAHVTSLLQLEALLLVFENGRRSRSAAQLSGEMYVPASALAGWLDGFVAAGFCERTAEGYRLPDSETVYELLSEVADCYVRRRISLGRLVFGAPGEDARASFSDAFRLRKDR